MVPRTVKDPEERRTEILDTAEELFNRNGVDNTSVDDIVREMDVAKGTFYYYFKSKDELISAVIDRFVEKLWARLPEITGSPDQNAVGKMLAFFNYMAAMGQERERLMRFIHEERNRYLHYTIQERAMKIFIPEMTKVVRQGVEEGTFRTPYPEDCAAVLMVGIGYVGHELKGAPKDRILRHIDFTQFTFEKMLGTEPGTFDEFQKWKELVK